MATARTYGEKLPDQVDRIASLSDAQLGLLSDVREIFKDRATLEKEYATKLSALAKRAADRKAKRMASLVVGDEPAMAWGEDTLRQSTLDTAYTQLIGSLESTAQDHAALSDVLSTQVADATKSLEKKHEEMKTKQLQFYQKLLADRDKIYADRIKMKQKYDEECLEIEAYRRKQDRSSDDKHASRAAKQYESQVVDMQNGKNTFLISTAIANTTKTRFYTEDLPLIEDDFQRLQTNLISGFVSLLQHAQSLHTGHLAALQSRVTATQAVLAQVAPDADQALYVGYNTRPFSVPGDWGWEPCAGYYDTGEMAVADPAPRVFLQNKLSRCRAKMAEVGAIISSKKREVEKLSSIVDAYMKDRGMGDVDDVTNNYLDAQHQLTLLEFSASVLGAEIDTTSSALGGDEGSQSPHNFKSASFSIPTTCGYCKSSIWGLSKQGKTCKSCGLSVHAKCELKVPADCGDAGGGTRAPRSPGASLSRADSRASTISAKSPATPSSYSFARPHAVPEETFPSAHVLYSFTPTSPFELAVSGGSTVKVIEEDDGSGWIKVADSRGGKGLVPASYIELIDEEDEEPEVETKPPPPAFNRASKPAPKPRTLGSGKFVRGLYTYQASGPDELSIDEGSMIELSSGPNGGQNYGDGWWEGYDKSGNKGIFPSNYVELA